MANSTFIKLNKNVLLQYVYDTNNLILEPYQILYNSKTIMSSYEAGSSSITNNNQSNQLFLVNAINNSYAQVNQNQYSFLNISNYVMPSAIQHDRVQIYLPVNFTFGEYQGFYIRLYTYDYNNKNFFEISNFFFNINNQSTSNLLIESIPPLLYQGTLWDKYIEVDVPSIYQVALQSQSGKAIPNTINYNLTNGVGLSQTSPLFVDFHFITSIQTVGNLTNYLTTTAFTSQIPQSPDLQSLQVVIEESSDGDYFEIYAIYNGNNDNFISFMDSSVQLGFDYYILFTVTVYEQNIDGTTLTYKIEDDFSETVIFRPILKYSSTTAIINVQMQLINQADNSIIIRNAAYGLTSDQISKYGLYFSKVKVSNVYTPTIYNKNATNFTTIFSLKKYIPLETTIQVPFPVLVNTSEICAYSKQAINNVSSNKLDNYHPFGELEIEVKPFDNIFRFIIADKVISSGITGSNTALDPVNLSNCQNLQIIFQNDTTSLNFQQYIDNQTSAKNGMCNFKVPQSSFKDINNIYQSGINVFYITTTNQNFETVIYAGLFKPSSLYEPSPSSLSSPQLKQLIIDDPSAQAVQQGTAIVTRQAVPINTLLAPTQSIPANIQSATAIPADKYNISSLLGTFSSTSSGTQSSQSNSTTATLFTLLTYSKLNSSGSPNSLGGTITKNPNTSQSSNNKFTLTANDQTINNSVYTFESWYVNSGLTPTGFSTTSRTISITLLSNTTIYAYFTTPNSGGNSGGTNPGSNSGNRNVKITAVKNV